MKGARWEESTAEPQHSLLILPIPGSAGHCAPVLPAVGTRDSTGFWRAAALNRPGRAHRLLPRCSRSPSLHPSGKPRSWGCCSWPRAPVDPHKAPELNRAQGTLPSQAVEPPTPTHRKSRNLEQDLWGLRRYITGVSWNTRKVQEHEGQTVLEHDKGRASVTAPSTEGPAQTHSNHPPTGSPALALPRPGTGRDPPPAQRYMRSQGDTQ